MNKINNTWYLQHVNSILKKFNVNKKTGLKSKQVVSQRKKHGSNKITERKPVSRFKILIQQFKSPLMYILVIAAIVTVFLDHATDSIIIFAAVALNAVVGYLQEFKAMNTLEQLRKILKVKAIVIRNGHEKEIPQEEIVPGDIVVLQSGQKIPADGRIVQLNNLSVNEASLTGEWLPAKKYIESIKKEVPLADRNNMVFMGTIVETGRGLCVVTATGQNTEFGKIAQLVQDTKESKTPFQIKIEMFSKKVSIFIVIICIITFFGGIMLGQPVVDMFLVVIALVVAAIPEGLPAIISIFQFGTVIFA